MGILRYIQQQKEKFRAVQHDSKVATLKAQNEKLQKEKIRVDQEAKLQNEREDLKRHIAKTKPKGNLQKVGGAFKNAAAGMAKHINENKKSEKSPFSFGGGSPFASNAQNTSPFAQKKETPKRKNSRKKIVIYT